MDEQALEYLQRALSIDQTNNQIWEATGHCYLMMDDLPKAHEAYQQALYRSTNVHVSQTYVFLRHFNKDL